MRKIQVILGTVLILFYGCRTDNNGLHKRLTAYCAALTETFKTQSLLCDSTLYYKDGAVSYSIDTFFTSVGSQNHCYDINIFIPTTTCDIHSVYARCLKQVIKAVRMQGHAILQARDSCRYINLAFGTPGSIVSCSLPESDYLKNANHGTLKTYFEDTCKPLPGWITDSLLNYVYDSLKNSKGVDTVIGELEYSPYLEADKKYTYSYNVVLVGQAFNNMSGQECKTHAEQLVRKIYEGIKREQLSVDLMTFHYYNVKGMCGNIDFSLRDGDFIGQIGVTQ